RAPEAIEAFPEPPAAMAGHDVVQGGDHVGIPPQPRPRRRVVRRPRQPHGLTGAPHRDPVLLHQHRQDFTSRGRRHRFRPRTSLIAAFSRARSAYIRLSLAFSASSSFNRFSSATEAPAYFARHWKYVALLMLCWRRISATGTPASPCFRISTIWLSVNRDFRMGISLAPESLPSNCLPGGEAYATSKANEIFESPLPEPPVSDRQPSKKHTFLVQREDISALRPQRFRKNTES